MHRDFWSPGLSTHPTIDAPWTLAVRSPSLAYENLATEASCVNQIISNWVPHIVIFLSFQDPKGAMVKTWWDSQSSDSMDFLERWCEWTPYPIYIYTLVGGIPTPLKNMKVSWEYEFPDVWKIKHVANQQALYIYIYPHC